MDFIQTANKQADKFGPGEHGFSAGNPATGVPATFLSASWTDDVQQELVNVIKAAGIAPAAATRNQLLQALRSTGVFLTAAAGADDTRAATTAFVRAAIGNHAGFVSIVANTTLNASHWGKSLEIAGNPTITLPAASSVPSGTSVWITGNPAATITFETVSTLTIGNTAVATPYVATLGTSGLITSDGGAWRWMLGTEELRLSPLWATAVKLTGNQTFTGAQTFAHPRPGTTDPGGGLYLSKPATGSTLSGNVRVDLAANKFRVFEDIINFRGLTFDLTKMPINAAGVGLAVVAESILDATTGWRQYSDGTVEQWAVTAPFGGNASLVVPLLVALTARESVMVSNVGPPTNESAMWDMAASTLSQITVRRLNHGSGSGAGSVAWRVWGKA